MRQVILYIAMSLDGYIADQNGGVEWLHGEDKDALGDLGYDEFMKGIDTIIMGYKTYHQIVTELSVGEWVYPGKKTYVLSHQKHGENQDVEFINQPVSELIHQLKTQEGKNIWLCGGAQVVQDAVKTHVIDEYHITIIPTLLGRGIRLFGKQEERIPLKLVSTSHENGMLTCIYQNR